MLLSIEKLLADQGYSGSAVVHNGIVGDENDTSASNYRAYDERVNGNLKRFNSLSVRFRYTVQKHNYVLFAVANIVQVGLEKNAHALK